MTPLLTGLLGTFLVVYVIQKFRGHPEGASALAGRYGLAVMFLMTGVSHFISIEPMAEMVPPPFPPVPTVLATGVLEILGAVGLLIPGRSRVAAFCLFAFLLAVFPANIYAAMNEAGMGGHAEGGG